MELKGTRWFYTVDPNSINNLNDLAEHLASLLSSGGQIQNGRFLETKVLVERINNLKIQIYSKDHPPPHFHVSTDNINASFRIDNCDLIKGNIQNKDLKLIRYWYSISKNKLVEIWNNTRTADCTVGEYKNKM